jgi:hypothetical protein
MIILNDNNLNGLQIGATIFNCVPILRGQFKGKFAADECLLNEFIEIFKEIDYEIVDLDVSVFEIDYTLPILTPYLDAYEQAVLVVTEDIKPSETTGNSRAIVLFHFNANFLNKELVLVVGIYELDTNGELINSLKPYEDTIVATNTDIVDTYTPGLDIIAPENILPDQPEGRYMGEYDAYIKLTKHNSVELWSLFESIIKKSSKINPA